MNSQQTSATGAEFHAAPVTAPAAPTRTKPTRRAAALLAGVAVAASVTTCVLAPQDRLATLATPVKLMDQVLMIGGLGWEDVPDSVMRSVMGARFADVNQYGVTDVLWPASLEPSLNDSIIAGVQSMDQGITDLYAQHPGEKIIVAGASAGTFVVNEEMALLAQRIANGDPVPPADQLEFIVLGDGNRGMFKGFIGVELPLLKYTMIDLPVTPYNVTVVTGEYDGMGNWPDRWWNLLADFNALAGTSVIQQALPTQIVDALHLEEFGSVHREAMDADLSLVPEKNITVSAPNALGGVTTTYIVPTPDLPMLRPLKGFGVSQETIDALTTVLKPIIDSAYVRNDPVNPKPAPGHVRTATTQPVAAKSATANIELTVGPSAATSASTSASTSAKPARAAKAAKAAAAKSAAKPSASRASAGR